MLALGNVAPVTMTRNELQVFYPASVSGGVGSSILPMPDRGCVYVRNPKVACSTIILWLHRIHTGDHTFNPTNVHAEHLVPRPSQIGWKRTIEMLSGEAFRFTFVRNPVQRAESAYRDKVVREKRWRAGLQAVLGMPEDDTRALSFEEFVTALEVADPLYLDPHFRPQHLNLMHGLVEFDLIGRLESFDADLARVRAATGLPDVPVEVRNQRPRDGSLFDGRPDLRARVEAVFARDMELYSY